MSNLFILLFLLSLLAFIVGLINPRLVIRWGKKKDPEPGDFNIRLSYGRLFHIDRCYC